MRVCSSSVVPIVNNFPYLRYSLNGFLQSSVVCHRSPCTLLSMVSHLLQFLHFSIFFSFMLFSISILNKLASGSWLFTPVGGSLFFIREK